MRVLLTRRVHPAATARLRDAGLEVDERTASGPVPRAELLERVAGCQALIPMPTDRIDGAVLDAGPLAVVANHAVGVDNIDLAAARERGVVVCNTPGVLTDATADLTLALILAATRRVTEADRYVRRGDFDGWGPELLVGGNLRGAVLGIVGLGRIGRAVADRAVAFGLRVEGRTRSTGPSLERLLATADILSLHCPLTRSTHHLIGEPELRAMKPTAVLINTARGPVVDEAALARALREGWIAGAGLDVFEDEPRVHPELMTLENAVLLPHIGSATRATRQRMAELAVDAVLAVFEGREPTHRLP